jgi:RHS repeat-associated protein
MTPFLLSTVVDQDQDVYNGLGQLTGEFQSVSGPVVMASTPEVQYSFSDPSLGCRQTSMTYPNGRELDDVYNTGIDTTIGRVSALADAGGSVAGTDQSYVYQGLATIVGNTDGNGVAETTTLDNFGRTGEMNYVNMATGASTDDFQYGYDRDGNVLYKNNVLDSAESELYHSNSTTSGDNGTAYDPLNRLTGFERGTLSSSGNNGTTLDTVASASSSQSWNLNAVGDQNSVTTNGVTTTNTTNAKNELTANGSSSLTFDNNGNETTDENGQTTVYDAWNRAITVKNAAGGTIASYSYDPQSRRVTEVTGGTTTAIYFTNRWQAIEELQSGTVTRQNVWGLGYVNQLVERDDNTTSGNLGVTGSGLGERLYAQQDANWDVTSLVSTSGNIVEHMLYSPYGAASFLTANWTPTSDAYAQNVLFQGGRFQASTGNYGFDHRDYDPTLGLWLQQDSLGYVNGVALQRAYENAPTTVTDYLGTCVEGKKYSPTVEVHASPSLSNPELDIAKKGLVEAAGDIETLDTLLSDLDYAAIAAAGDAVEALGEAIKTAAEHRLDWPEPKAEELAQSVLDFARNKSGDFEGWNVYTRINYKVCVCEHHWYHVFLPTNELEDQSTPWVMCKSGGIDEAGTFDTLIAAETAGGAAGDDALAKWKDDNKDDLGD